MEAERLGGDRVDVDSRRRQAGGWTPVREALGVRGVGVIKRSLPSSTYGLDTTVEDVSGREECKPGVVVLVVVPQERTAGSRR
jgi:hypothetical protein